jgi:hypothetical protein
MLVKDDTTIAMYVDGVRDSGNNMAENVQPGTSTNFYFGTNYGAVGTQIPNAVFDEIVASDINRFASPFTFGNAPDINVSLVEGENLFWALPSFSYSADGNLTIDFNVFDADNDRLTLDLNFSTQAAVDAPGVIVFNDLNLTSDICTDQDWDDKGSECSVDVNILNRADANWFVHVEINDSSDTDSNASGYSFLVDNTAPTSVSFYPAASSDVYVSEVFLNHEVSDNNSGVRGCWYSRYIGGSRDVNGWIDQNAQGFVHHEYDWLNVDGENIYLIFYVCSDYADNNLYQIVQTGTWTRRFASEVVETAIEDQDLLDVFNYTAFEIFQTLGLYIMLFIFLAIAGLLVYVVLTKTT